MKKEQLHFTIVRTCLVVFAMTFAGCGKANTEVEPVEHLSNIDKNNLISINQDNAEGGNTDKNNTESENRKDYLSIIPVEKGGVYKSTYLIRYHDDISNEIPDEFATRAISGCRTQLRSLAELNFYKADSVFEGWRIYRDSDNKWYLRDASGTEIWKEVKDNQLPDGYQYALRGDASFLVSPTDKGNVDLFAQWGVSSDYSQYEIYYHPEFNINEMAYQTTVGYSGIKTALLSIEELGFDREGCVFKGWAIYRDVDDKWYIKDKEGEERWDNLENGNLPENYSYAIREDRALLNNPTKAGKLHLFATWEDNENYNKYVIEYYPDNKNEIFIRDNGYAGIKKYLMNIEDMGVEYPDCVFEGWRVYREVDNKWFVKNKKGEKCWLCCEENELPDGYSYALLGNGDSLTRPTTDGVVKLYANWVEWNS